MAPHELDRRPQGSGDGALRRLLRRMGGRPPRAVPQADTARDRLPEGLTTLARAALRVPVTVQGTVTIVTVNPTGENRWLEAVLDDGTGDVVLVWMGRRTVRGITAGRALRVTGTITLHEGRRTMYNPNYALQA